MRLWHDGGPMESKSSWDKKITFSYFCQRTYDSAEATSIGG